MAQEKLTQPENPLTTLSEHLTEDMRQVNSAILNHMQSDVALIPQLASYLIAAGGKRIRPLLTLAATAIHAGNMSRAHGLAASVEFIHTATLLHDDVVDESDQRRGQDSANLIFGNQASVLVGDFLFSRAFQLMTADGNLEILKILSSASAVISEGEVMQLTTANNIDTTFDEYLEVIKAKTAALFAAATEIGPVIAGADKAQQQAMHDYGMYLGIAFQIADDALDYAADQATLGKTIGDDFREGKMTLPVILAIQNASEEEREFWQRTLGNKDQTEDDLAHAQSLIAKHDCITKTLNTAREYGRKAQEALNTTPSHELRTLLHALIPYTIERKI
ncbi:MAG: polyprenyl synthetase family protein [Alphaproteobacteria bacterium]